MKTFTQSTILILSLVIPSMVFAHGDINDNGVVFSGVDVSPGIIMLQGKGGNIGLLEGDDGLLLIDDGYAANVGALEQYLDKRKGKARFVLNTHWHGDHTGGNAHLGEYVTIVAHDNVRKRLSSAQEIKAFGMKFEPSPAVALPIVTYDKSLSLHFNGQEIKAMHYPNGHTDGDSIVMIQPANVVHMGDHFFSGRYPFVDLESGGDVIGMANNVKAVIDMINPEVKVIPGHGPLSTRDDLLAYHDMLVATTRIVRAAIDQGMTIEQVQKQGFPPKWKSWGRGFIDQDTWIKTIYTSLKMKK